MSNTPQRRARLLRRTLTPQVLLATAALTLAGSVTVPVAAIAAPIGRPLPATTTHQVERTHGARCLRQFERAVQAYLDTTHSRDVGGYEKLLDPGYTIVLPGGTVFAGRKASESFIERFFARTDWTQTFQQTSQSVNGCRTGLVVFDSVYTDEDGPAPLVIALTWTYRGGRWLLLTDQNTVQGS